MDTLFVYIALVLAGILSLGANAGSYRRPIHVTGTGTIQPNRMVFGLLSDCYDVPVFDLCTGERIGSAYDCVYNLLPVPDCAGGLNLTTTTTFRLPGGNLTVRS